MTTAPIAAKDLAELEPKSEEERHKRAMYLAAQMGRMSIQLIRKCLDHCDAIDFAGGQTAKKLRPQLNNAEHYQAMKEVCALCIWLALAEQLTAGMPNWLKVFFCDSWACSDILFDSPTSKQVLAWYPPTRDLNTTCQTAATRMCNNLHLSGTVDDAVSFFAQTLANAASVRGEILSDALKRPLSELHRKIEEPVQV
jgi:hypothetical protein